LHSSAKSFFLTAHAVGAVAAIDPIAHVDSSCQVLLLLLLLILMRHIHVAAPTSMLPLLLLLLKFQLAPMIKLGDCASKRKRGSEGKGAHPIRGRGTWNGRSGDVARGVRHPVQRHERRRGGGEEGKQRREDTEWGRSGQRRIHERDAIASDPCASQSARADAATWLLPPLLLLLLMLL
jgi:hypothetical protein